jgi:hypothetical protein
MSRNEIQLFQQKMAMHFFATGTAFQRIEDSHLKAAIRCLRSDENLLPNRKQLATTLLDVCHKDLLSKVTKYMTGSTACLITDGWSNVMNDPIVNYMTVSPDCSLFFESVATGEVGHSHTFIANDIARVILKNEHIQFAGAVTDNTAANKKAWLLLEERFPGCYFHGCCSHGIHLLVKDIFAATKTEKQGDLEASSFPTGYPFEEMQIFVAECRRVVK